jgi:hypothetical protein
MNPIGSWRLPTANEMSYANTQHGTFDAYYGVYNNNTLFPNVVNQIYITSTPMAFFTSLAHIGYYPNIYQYV